jgi:hypothetical protein
MTVAASPSNFITLQNAAQIEPLKNYSVAIDHTGVISKVGPNDEVAQWVEN